jgi:hypothetical protein
MVSFPGGTVLSRSYQQPFSQLNDQLAVPIEIGLTLDIVFQVITGDRAYKRFISGACGSWYFTSLLRAYPRALVAIQRLLDYA